MKMGLVTTSDLDSFSLVLAQTARGVPPAGVCTVAALADVNHIQNDRHRRIRGIRLATW